VYVLSACDEVHNLAFLVLILLVVAIEGLIAVHAEEVVVVVQEGGCLVTEDRPRLFEKHYHRRL
jgi:hypothetical protein